MKSKKSKEKLDVEKIVREFEQSEKSRTTRKGSFQIQAPFEEAIEKILKAKPGHKRGTKEK